MDDIINITGIIGEKLFETIKTQASFSRELLNYSHFFFNGAFYAVLYIAFFVSMIYILISIIATFNKDKTHKELKFIEDKAPSVTVQIPTKNEIIALRCAKKCIDFDYPKNKFEILIGDDSDDSKVSKEIEEFATQYDMIHVFKRKNNKGFKPGNLNNLLKHSKGEILVIFDSDFIPERDFLRRIVTPFIHDKHISATQARWEFINTRQNLNTVLAASIQYVFHYLFLPIMKKEGICSLCGSAEAVRKSDLIEYGGWASGSLTEDIEYTLRLHENGKKIVYLPNLLCYNELPTTLMDLYRQQMRWGYGVVDAYKNRYRTILSSKKISTRQKVIAFSNAFGYIVPLLIGTLTTLGVLSFVTHPPGPIDIQLFVTETGRNIILTFGLIVASGFALYKAKKTDLFLKMLISSFTIGLVVTFYVNKGILKAISNKPMNWYLLKKSTSYM